MLASTRDQTKASTNQTPGIQSGIMSGRSGMMLPGDKGRGGGGAGVECGVSVPLVGACRAHERGGESVNARVAFCAVPHADECARVCMACTGAGVSDAVQPAR